MHRWWWLRVQGVRGIDRWGKGKAAAGVTCTIIEALVIAIESLALRHTARFDGLWQCFYRISALPMATQCSTLCAVYPAATDYNNNSEYKTKSLKMGHPDQLLNCCCCGSYD